MKLATVLGLVVVSAVFCNVHAADFVWDGGANAGTEASRYWTLPGNWSPDGQPAAGQSVLVNISDPYAVANADLPGTPVEVAAGGLVVQPSNVTISSPITLSGGTWSVGTDSNYHWGDRRTLNGPLAITAPSRMTGVRGNYLYVNGALSGNGQITFESTDAHNGEIGATWHFNAADSQFSGPIVIEANNASIVAANASRALGTGDVTVRTGSSLRIGKNQDYSGATRTPTVYLEGGRIVTGADVAAGGELRNARIPFDIVVQSQGGTIGSDLPNGWGENNTYSGLVTLNGPLTLAGTRSNTTSFTVSGRIAGNYPVTLNTTDVWIHDGHNYRGRVVLSNPNNSFTSLTVQMGYLQVANEGAVSTGPITIHNPDAFTGFYLDKPTSADWTLTNDITASAPIQVEDGSANYTLNLAGSALTVGTSSTNAASLSVAGNLAFARDGAALAALNIDIIGSGSPLVVTNDRLAVNRSVSGLANANLNISISGLELADVAGQLFTIVTSANDLSNQEFASVTVPQGWAATVFYGNGFVKVLLRSPDPDPVIVLTPQSLSFRIRSGEANPTSASVQVQNVGGDHLQWTATVLGEPAPSWITLNNATGTDNNSFIVNIRRQGVPVGTHTADVEVRDANPNTSPKTLTVILNTVLILVGDINNDQYVNVGDLQLLVAAWGSQAGPPPSINWNPDADINADGYVNVGDLQLLVAHWGETTFDPAAPAAVTNLAADDYPAEHSLTLTWTAPGDDGTTGTADSYDIRYRMGGPVTDANWDTATQVTGEPAPAAAGTSQSMVVGGLNSGITYYFAMKTSDDVPNTSAISNSPYGTTTGAPVKDATFVSQSVPTSMIAGQTYAVSVTMRNSGTTTWTEAAGYRLGSQIPQNNTTWGMNRAHLAGGESIAPGQDKTFSWTVTAPTTPGIYTFQWKMALENVAFFGDRTPSLAITVSAGGDTTAPAAVGNLVASNPTSDSITLSWTAPGDDGFTGTATSYDIRYSTSAINEANWASATHVMGEPAPAVAGTSQNMVVSGLADSTTYYFAIKTRDEAPNSNTSAISNSPSGTTTSGSGSGTGLRGEYFDDENFVTLALTRTDATVDFDWGGGGSPDPSIWVDNFSIRWTGQVQAQYSETYTFYTVSDDGVRLWVNGQLLIDHWASHGPTEDSGLISLTAGVKYDIRMEYYENASGAVARLLWSSASTPKAVIPQTQLFPATVCSDTTAPAAVSNLRTTNLSSDYITLLWTAPGDDGSTGTATSYDLRYSTSQITEGNWASATQVTGEPIPAAAGTEQSMVVAGLLPSTTYYFAIKASDGIPNVGALSSASAATTSSGTIWNVSTESQLQFAMANYDSGDTVSIADGTYTPVGFRIACTRGAITVKGASGNRDNVILQGQGMLANSGVANEMVEVVSDNVTIQDLTIRGVSTFGIHVRGEDDCDNPTFRNLKLIDCGERFIKGSAFLGNIDAIVDNLLVENCYFEQITELSGRSDNDYIAGMDMMTLNNPIIRDCTFKNIRGATGGGRGAIFLWLGITNATVERNTIIGCDRGICVGNPAAPAGVYMPNYHSIGGVVRNNVVVRGEDIAMELCYTKDLKVYYNTVYSADTSYFRTVHIFDTEARTTNLQLSYNILRGEIYRNYTGQVIETGNLTGSTPATNWFVDATNGNLHLTASATPAFNAGVLLPEVPTDFDGANRSSTPDIGAYEY